MTAKKAQKLRNGLLITGFVLGVLGSVLPPLFYIGLLLIFACMVPHFLWNKCPYCGRQLGRNEGDYCQHCGEKIQ